MAGGSASYYYPGTDQPVTKSYDDRIRDLAEFDDALLDQQVWKNPRYDGCKLTQTEYNEYNVEDISFLTLPTLTNKTTALYIANTVIGGTEDPQFATIKGHSYVGIQKILIINTLDDSVQVLDRASEPYEEFHRFITNDLPTGAKCKLKLLDDSVQSNLSGRHRVKMNKGYLLKTLRYESAGDISQSQNLQPLGATNADFNLENNSLYLYASGVAVFDYISESGDVGTSPTNQTFNNQLRFRYGMLEMFDDSFSDGSSVGHKFDVNRMGPSYASASLFENKFTRQFYSGAYGHLIHQPGTGSIAEGGTNAQRIASTALGSASRFIAHNCLNFLDNNNSNFDRLLNPQDRTEIHVTFFEGTKDFTKGVNSPVSAHDERSIGTFEVDQSLASLGIESADHCNDGLPTNHEILLKGPNDGRFMPTLTTFQDNFVTAHLVATESGPYSGPLAALSGCVQPDHPYPEGGGSPSDIQIGITADKVNNARIYVQGGALGMIGYEGCTSASGTDYNNPQTEEMTSDNFYSGSSFTYELSFLDKDHTLILDLDKNAELFDGIGNKGVLIIPQWSLTKVKFNLEYYLEKAGIITETTNVTTNVATETYARD